MITDLRPLANSTLAETIHLQNNPIDFPDLECLIGQRYHYISTREVMLWTINDMASMATLDSETLSPEVNFGPLRNLQALWW
jgi:hypothetical protein